VRLSRPGSMNARETSRTVSDVHLRCRFTQKKTKKRRVSTNNQHGASSKPSKEHHRGKAFDRKKKKKKSINQIKSDQITIKFPV
jgi:hypothetical protein